MPVTGLISDIVGLNWREAKRYCRSDPEDRHVLERMEIQFAGLNLIDTPIWVFDTERCQCLWANPAGLRVWKAQTVPELQVRDVAATQSEAVYTLLNDYLYRVAQGESVGCWVTLDPRDTTHRFYQLHHLVVLADGRQALLIEAQAEPPAEEMLAFASNHTLTIGLFELDGRFVSGNPPFSAIATRTGFRNLNECIPPESQLENWPSLIETRSTLAFEAEFQTDRGKRWFRCELRRVLTHTKTPRAMLSLFDQTEERIANAESAHHEAVAESLRLKEVLLKEIHHRVKNNLQIISSLLMLQLDELGGNEGSSSLRESAFRVQSMALIHEQLYGLDTPDHVDLGEYARKLSRSLLVAFAPTASLRVEAPVVEVPVDLAVTLGLILNEMITNAFKYGVPVPGTAPGGQERMDCDVLVEISNDRDAIRIAVTDSGPGFPEDVDPESTPSLGLHLVRALSRQVRGTLTVKRTEGARVELCVPKPPE